MWSMRISSILACLLCLFGLPSLATNQLDAKLPTLPKSPGPNILFDGEPGSGAGSLSGGTFEDDEDFGDQSGSGSGSGSGQAPIVYVYDMTFNISSEKWSSDLSDVNSEAFKLTALKVKRQLERVFEHLHGEQIINIISFSKGSLMVDFELIDKGGEANGDMPVKMMKDKLQSGQLGEGYQVSMQGFKSKVTQLPVFEPPTPKPTPTRNNGNVNRIPITPPKKDQTSTTTTTVMTSGPTVTTTYPTTPRPLTECQRQDKFFKKEGKPRCNPWGEFDTLQCIKDIGTDDCWCSDLHGKPIPGTEMEAPNYPDCERGYNLQPCVLKLVQYHRSKLLGRSKPRCSQDGMFERVQCHEALCYCVNEESGQKIIGTDMRAPAMPNCDDETFPIDTKDNIIPEEPKEGGESTVEEGGRTNVEMPEIDIHIGTDDPIDLHGDSEDKDGSNPKYYEKDDEESDDNRGDDDDEDNRTGNDGQDEIHKGTPEENRSRVTNEILTQPGLLGGIIGGAVVILLGLVLLIMFAIYRMRKKDEGSYPLDEPRKPNYSYIRAPEKEYFA